MKKVFLLALLVFITACTPRQQVLDNQNGDNLQIVQEEKRVVTQSEYEGQVKTALQGYYTTNDVTAVKDQIVSLTVPAEYLDVHFELVVAFELLDQGQKQNDQSKIDQGQKKLEELSKTYTWLK